MVSIREDGSHGIRMDKNVKKASIEKKKRKVLGLNGMRMEIQYWRAVTMMEN